ncbi:MAG: hypothetical protein KG003_02685 [Bacteroidetes bacterium]|nr:hypothetical protein [Bacteroidota bacterium]
MTHISEPNNSPVHTFHIPVMGLAFTIDTPIKVAHLGISSVVSIGDHFLSDKVRIFYGEKYSIPVQHVSKDDVNARATITTSYLNLLNEIVYRNWQEHISQLVFDGAYRDGFFAQLPNPEYWQMEWLHASEKLSATELLAWAENQFKPGNIDVNIMTKLDKKNFRNGKELPIEYNDAHSVLRGFALSDLQASVVLSAGMNMPLFSYMQNFEDFFPDANGRIKKKIIIKVSDFRSALVQGKILAKKGLWVSEFRIESGLNCGGHAFPTQGYLMGPILEEFKQRRNELYNELFGIWQTALVNEKNSIKPFRPELKISAQGGVGTHDEHQFLLKHYGMNTVGWGSPFLLVPDAVSIDNETLHQLSSAREKDLYLSNASPMGVPFNNLRNTSRQLYQKQKVVMGKPGNPCTKKFLQLNTEFSEKAICTASSKYIHKALENLQNLQLTETQLAIEKEKLFEKECLCCGLAMPFLEENKLDKKIEGKGVSVCPGPNIAYFEGVYSLKDMIRHIYGMKNLITRTDRPNMFIKEIQLYMDYLSDKLSAFQFKPNEKDRSYLHVFIQNMQSGMEYYQTLFKNELQALDLKQGIQQLLLSFLESLELKQTKLSRVLS